MSNDLLLFDSTSHSDSRGFFRELYNKKNFLDLPKFVQDNVSYSKKNIIRGLHFQSSPFSQGKFISVIKGKIFDVAVNINKDSKDFGIWKSFILSAESNNQLWMPGDYAHGFMALDEENYVLYKATDFYKKESEKTILWNDKDLAIEWPIKDINPIVSDKDQSGLTFKETFTSK